MPPLYLLASILACISGVACNPTPVVGFGRPARGRDPPFTLYMITYARPPVSTALIFDGHLEGIGSFWYSVLPTDTPVEGWCRREAGDTQCEKLASNKVWTMVRKRRGTTAAFKNGVAAIMPVGDATGALSLLHEKKTLKKLLPPAERDSWAFVKTVLRLLIDAGRLAEDEAARTYEDMLKFARSKGMAIQAWQRWEEPSGEEERAPVRCFPLRRPSRASSKPSPGTSTTGT